MLPSSMRRDRGVAFVTALPLIPQHAPLDVVELRPDGSLHDVITLNPSGVDALHDTTKEAFRVTTPAMHRTARDLERFALRPGMTLTEAVRSVREMHRNAGISPAADETPVASEDTMTVVLAKIRAAKLQLEAVTESIAELRHMLRATSRDERKNAELKTIGHLVQQSGRLATESANTLQAAGDLSTHVPHAWSGHIPRPRRDMNTNTE